MSIRYIEKAMWAKGLGKTNKAVLIAIADAVSDNGIGWLLISSIIKKTDLSERAIQSAISELSDTREDTVLPILERRERAKRSSIFRIHLDRIPQHEHWQSDKEMSAEEMWGAGDAPLKPKGAGDAPHPRTRCTPPPQALHPEPSLEPSIEPFPSLPSEETPPEDLFDSNLPVVIESKPSIIEYVDAEWKKLAGEYPRTVGIRVWNDSRRKGVAKRAQEGVRAFAGTVDAYQIWDMIFAAVRGDRFLRGEAEPTRDYPTAFALEIDTMLRPKFFARTLEKAATNELDNVRTSDPRTGRQYGPAEQATRAAIERLRAARQPG